MTTLELPRYGSLAPTDSHAVCDELLQRRNDLDRQHNNLESYPIGDAELVLHTSVGVHDSVVIDISKHPGDAFKFVSALGGGLTLPEGVDTGLVPSAGNYSKAFSAVCKLIGKSGIAYVPEDVNPKKRADMVAQGMAVRPFYANVAEAIPAAWNDAQQDPSLAFMHPYDNPNGIAALTILADQVIGGLVKLEADGQLDLQSKDVQILVQRGGGSLLAAMACRLYQAKAAGVLGENVTVHEVRPERRVDGSLDPAFDGLKVDKPGSYAAPILSDPDFVQGAYCVGQPAVADAMRQVAEVSGVTYETNALVGLAATHQVAPQTERPTVFVSLLTGRNATSEQREAFLGMPGLHGPAVGKNAETETAAAAMAEAVSSASNVAGVPRAIGTALLSGYTAAYRTHTPLPDARLQDPGRYTPDKGAIEDYYVQLEESGVVLLPRSRQHKY